jgi:hypothetical protein
LKSDKSVDIRPRISRHFYERLRARANNKGFSVAEALRYYVALGMQTEESIPTKFIEIGEIRETRPPTSRKHCMRFYIDSDIIPYLKPCPLAEASVSKYVSYLIRRDLLARKNKNS